MKSSPRHRVMLPLNGSRRIKAGEPLTVCVWDNPPTRKRGGTKPNGIISGELLWDRDLPYGPFVIQLYSGVVSSAGEDSVSMSMKRMKFPMHKTGSITADMKLDSHGVIDCSSGSGGKLYGAWSASLQRLMLAVIAWSSGQSSSFTDSIGETFGKVESLYGESICHKRQTVKADLNKSIAYINNDSAQLNYTVLKRGLLNITEKMINHYAYCIKNRYSHREEC